MKINEPARNRRSLSFTPSGTSPHGAIGSLHLAAVALVAGASLGMYAEPSVLSTARAGRARFSTRRRWDGSWTSGSARQAGSRAQRSLTPHSSKRCAEPRQAGPERGALDLLVRDNCRTAHRPAPHEATASRRSRHAPGLETACVLKRLCGLPGGEQEARSDDSLRVPKVDLGRRQGQVERLFL